MIMKENQIVHVMGYIYVVNGKVIIFSPETLDLTNSADVDYLLNLSKKLFVDDFYRPIYGKNTIVFVDKHSDEVSYIVSEGDFGGLPEECQRKVREVLDEFNESGGGSGNQIL